MDAKAYQQFLELERDHWWFRGRRSVYFGLLRHHLERERPEHAAERPHHLRAPSTSSFPSGHASAAAMAVTLLNEGSRIRPLNAALGAVVASSRVHVRIHHASDIVVGLAVGRVLAKVWQRVWPAR